MWIAIPRSPFQEESSMNGKVKDNIVSDPRHLLCLYCCCWVKEITGFSSFTATLDFGRLDGFLIFVVLYCFGLHKGINVQHQTNYKSLLIKNKYSKVKFLVLPIFNHKKTFKKFPIILTSVRVIHKKFHVCTMIWCWEMIFQTWTILRGGAPRSQ